MAMNLAAIHYGLTLNETLVAATINAAYALKRSHNHGSLEVGKRGDAILLNASDWRHMIYRFGDTRPLIRCVLKGGQIVFHDKEQPTHWKWKLKKRTKTKANCFICTVWLVQLIKAMKLTMV